MSASAGKQMQRASTVNAWAPARAPATEGAGAGNESSVSDAGVRVIQLPHSIPEKSVQPHKDEDAGTMPACVPRGAVEVCDGLDDDCDQKVDEGCSCVEGNTGACYLGPGETLNVGACHAGEQRCEQGTWRACMGSVTPQAETCNDMDDDCDGHVDEGFDFNNDPQHCGKCGNVCGKGSSCCNGQCVDLQSDYHHCGACGSACGTGQLPGCCDGKCVDLLTDRTCGSCSNACGLLKLGGGFLCHCQMVESGPACVGDALGMGLQVCR